MRPSSGPRPVSGGTGRTTCRPRRGTLRHGNRARWPVQLVQDVGLGLARIANGSASVEPRLGRLLLEDEEPPVSGGDLGGQVKSERNVGMERPRTPGTSNGGCTGRVVGRESIRVRLHGVDDRVQVARRSSPRINSTSRSPRPRAFAEPAVAPLVNRRMSSSNLRRPMVSQNWRKYVPRWSVRYPRPEQLSRPSRR